MIEAAVPTLPLGAAAAAGTALGLIAGSFAATVVRRWPEGRSVARGRSRCDSCDRPLTAAELMPLLGYLACRGRCRTCGAAIDPLHPVVEALAAVIGAAALAVAPGWDGVAGALFGWTLLTLAALDLRHRWLPDALTLPLLGGGIVAGLAGLEPTLADRVIGAAAGFAVLWLIAWAYRLTRGREGLGGGDPKLLAALGAWLGWASLPDVVLIAALGGLAAAAALMLAGRKVAATDALPFGTLLAAAGFGAWLATRLNWLAWPTTA